MHTKRVVHTKRHASSAAYVCFTARFYNAFHNFSVDEVLRVKHLETKINTSSL